MLTIFSALKILKDVGQSNEEYGNEVKILRSLRHPNIVLFMGVSITETTRVIVTELMPGASLDKLIHKQVKKKQAFHNALTFTKKVELLLDVVKGMIYLHGLQPAIVHRDLKPSVSSFIFSNIL
jgi:serine/threonine protein kinase